MSDYKKKLALSALAAGLIGYGLGILTAPKSGRETREDIKKTASSATKSIEFKLKKYHSEITELIAEAKIIGLSFRGKAKDELKKLIAGSIEARHRVSLALSALHEGDKIDEDLETAIAEASAAIVKLNSFIEEEKDSE